MFPPFWGYFQVLVKYTKKIRAYNNNGSQTDENVASIKNVLIIILLQTIIKTIFFSNRTWEWPHWWWKLTSFIFNTWTCFAWNLFCNVHVKPT